MPNVRVNEIFNLFDCNMDWEGVFHLLVEVNEHSRRKLIGLWNNLWRI